jgi:hypothetical protein
LLSDIKVWSHRAIEYLNEGCSLVLYRVMQECGDEEIGIVRAELLSEGKGNLEWMVHVGLSIGSVWLVSVNEEGDPFGEHHPFSIGWFKGALIEKLVQPRQQDASVVKAWRALQLC